LINAPKGSREYSDAEQKPCSRNDAELGEKRTSHDDDEEAEEVLGPVNECDYGLTPWQKLHIRREHGLSPVEYRRLVLAQELAQGLNYDLQDNAFFSETRNRLQNNIFAEGK